MAYKLEKCILAAVAAAGVYGLWASRAEAQDDAICLPTTDMVAILANDYGEVEAGMGLIDSETGVLITAAPDGSTWTMVTMGTDGMSCILTAGTDWMSAPVPAGQGV